MVDYSRRTLLQTNVASVGSVFNDTRKVKVLSLPETIKDFSFIVSGSERTFTFRTLLHHLDHYLPRQNHKCASVVGASLISLWLSFSFNERITLVALLHQLERGILISK